MSRTVMAGARPPAPSGLEVARNTLTSILEIARHELMTALRTKRALWAAGIYVGSAILGGMVIVLIMRSTELPVLETAAAHGIDPGRAATKLSEGGGKLFMSILTRLLDVKPEEVAEPFRQSAITQFFFAGSLVFLPFFIVLTSSDQISGDLQTRAICYSTMRTSRVALLLGRASAQTVIFVVLTIIASLAWVALATALVPSFSLAPSLLTVLRILLLLIPFGLCHLAITTCCSSLFRQPSVASLAAFSLMAVLAGLWLTSAISPEGTLGWLQQLAYLSPVKYAGGLWMASLGRWLGSVAAYVGFALVFFGSAAVILTRRDL